LGYVAAEAESCGTGRTGVHAELGADVGEVRLDRSLADEQVPGQLTVRGEPTVLGSEVETALLRTARAVREHVTQHVPQRRTQHQHDEHRVHDRVEAAGPGQQ
jgi:hypothetical protein